MEIAKSPAVAVESDNSVLVGPLVMVVSDLAGDGKPFDSG